MSYAMETKKRKFDRILESLIEHPRQTAQPSDSRTLSNSRNNVPLAKINLLGSTKRRRVTPDLNRSVSNSSLLSRYLPSSREAFLQRLETYRHITKWHIPSTIPINAAAWARRGWICADVDTVSCGSCSERVTIDLTMDKRRHPLDTEGQEEETQQMEIGEDDDEVSLEIYQALIKRYQSMIKTSHADFCSWKKRGCDASIQRIEGLLNTVVVVESTRQRLKNILDNIAEIPPVASLPDYEELLAPKAEHLQAFGPGPADTDAVKLAICGWHYKEADVVECKHCFRSLGLWLYRGVTPTVEHLDATDSHLEYCPWRSPEAQDTELVIWSAPGQAAGKKVSLPGWALVYQAIEKQNTKKTTPDQNSLLASQLDGTDTVHEEMSPEQRDKKMKDLMRRIKEIRKPFNFKGLLRSKDRSDG